MRSTVEAFGAHVKNQFKVISEYAVARVEEGIFKSIQEELRRKLKDGEEAKVTMPWGTYVVDNMTTNNGGNYNIELKFSDDFINGLNDTTKAMYEDDFSESWSKLFEDFVMYGKFFDPDTEESKKMSGDIVKGVKLTTFQKEFFPNAYGDMLLKAAQQHKSEGEIYKIDLCDTCSHGTIEIEFKEDGAVPRFEAHTAFKQYLKDDAASDS